jgi:hypothetical protein
MSMQHFKHAILQQNISILIHQFGLGFFMKGTEELVLTSHAYLFCLDEQQSAPWLLLPAPGTSPYC